MILKEVNKILSDVSDISELIPLVIAWIYVSRKEPFTILKWAFSVSAPIKIITMLLARNNIHNMPWFHFLALWEGCMLFVFYSKVLFYKILWRGLAAIVLLNLGNTIFIEETTSFNSIAWSINTLIMLCLGLATFYRLYTTKKMTLPEENPLFIVNSGLMIYFSGALFTYILGVKILTSVDSTLFAESWIIVSVSNTIKNLIISYGLYLAFKNE
jgi:hypothetical protein